MPVQKLSTEGVTALIDLVAGVQQELFNSKNVQYFNMSFTDEPLIRDQNNQWLLNDVGRQSGVYAIWVQNVKSTTVRYIGHTDGKTARQRIRNHFIYKDPRTGSQLEQVNRELEKGNQVGFSFVVIDPPTVRLYVEDVLIRNNKPDWNIKSADRKRQIVVSDENPTLPATDL